MALNALDVRLHLHSVAPAENHNHLDQRLVGLQRKNKAQIHGQKHRRCFLQVQKCVTAHSQRYCEMQFLTWQVAVCELDAWQQKQRVLMYLIL